jgi:hypothetical protein
MKVKDEDGHRNVTVKVDDEKQKTWFLVVKNCRRDESSPQV